MTDEPTDRSATGESSRRTFLKSGALATGAIALGTGAVVSGRDGDGAAARDDQTETSPFASVQFANQESDDGTSVVVDQATLSEPGYVAFHDVSLFEGNVLESVIGVSDRLDAGVHYQTDVTLFDVPGADFETESLQGTGALIAMPHRETGDDETYDFVSSEGAEDGPFAENALPVVDLGFVAGTSGGEGTATDTPTDTATDTPTETPTDTPTDTPAGTGTDMGTGTDAASDETAPFATVDFENQVLDGDTVSVGQALLSDGGFVALHDARLLSGELFESVVGVSEYLEPGRHRTIEVTLDDPDQIAEVTFPPAPAKPLVPMPHLDTDGNETYDFVTSEGAEDGPYTSVGQAVVDLGFIVTEGEGTATGTAGAETEAPTDTETPMETPTDEGHETETEGY
ncbi:twin-arginine translocation signal domain-containing protein [Halosimplex aquaticum]|uniref:Twin-arginine translocation signal domain-containing protein n=1 Tax=Halosimplex aquaticum TaxID=3026162 RepID=A0ABD5Y5P4_9EURY|nr:twin-arginine translocation signal domain-containing protein [Halosimplex aquaticum]